MDEVKPKPLRFLEYPGLYLVQIKITLSGVPGVVAPPAEPAVDRLVARPVCATVEPAASIKKRDSADRGYYLDSDGKRYSDRTCRAETGRTNGFAVIHTAENAGAAAAGTAKNVAKWQNVQQEVPASGYHYLVDLGETLLCCDPDRYRAYGAIGGNDGIQIGLALRRSDFTGLSAANMKTLIDRVKAILTEHGISATRLTPPRGPAGWTRKTRGKVAYWTPPDPLTKKGIVAHSDIQSDRGDPGEAIMAAIVA